MARTNRLIAVDMYKADIEEAVDFVSVDALPHLRSGKPREAMIYVSDDAEEYFTKCNIRARASKRKNAHNQMSVPLKYQTKPKRKDKNRVSLRNVILDQDALDTEYARYSYEAAGVC